MSALPELRVTADGVQFCFLLSATIVVGNKINRGIFIWFLRKAFCDKASVYLGSNLNEFSAIVVQSDHVLRSRNKYQAPVATPAVDCGKLSGRQEVTPSGVW